MCGITPPPSSRSAAASSPGRVVSCKLRLSCLAPFKRGLALPSAASRSEDAGSDQQVRTASRQHRLNDLGLINRVTYRLRLYELQDWHCRLQLLDRKMLDQISRFAQLRVSTASMTSGSSIA